MNSEHILFTVALKSGLSTHIPFSNHWIIAVYYINYSVSEIKEVMYGHNSDRCIAYSNKTKFDIFYGSKVIENRYSDNILYS